MNGRVTGPEYDAEFRKLLHQWQMCAQSIPAFPGVDAFLTQNRLSHCVAAQIRLKNGKSGYSGEETAKNLAQRVFEITTKFITVIDILALNMTSVDELAPPVRDVHSALLSYPKLPQTYTGVQTLQKWIHSLERKSATDNLNDDEVRQIKYDLEFELQKFKDILS